MPSWINGTYIGDLWDDSKPSCRVATTANITLSGTQTIDGVAVVAGNRVLVKNQTTGSQNGIYVCSSGSWIRAYDADNTQKLTTGAFVFIEEGSINAGKGLVLTTAEPITLDTTSLAFSQFTGSGSSGTPGGSAGLLQYNNAGDFGGTTGIAYAANPLLTITSTGATIKPLIIKGDLSQSANLQDWQNSAGTVLASVASTGALTTGKVTIPTLDVFSGLHLTSTGSQFCDLTSNSGLVMATNQTIGFGAAGTSDCYLARDSAGVFKTTTTSLVVNAKNASTITLTVKAAASVSVNLQEWQNSAGTTLSAINTSGNFTGNAANVTGTVAIANGGTGQITANAAFNALIPSQTSNSGKYLTTDSSNTSWATITIPSAANPTASIGLSAVNGSATTYLRSDGASALSQAIVPTWTGKHIFNAAAGTIKAVFKGGASESVNLSEWQNSSATVLASVDASGNIVTPSVASGGNTPIKIDAHYGALTSDTDAATITFNMATSDKHTVTLGDNRTLATSNDQTGQIFTIVLKQDGTGLRTVTWWSGISWPAGTTPTLTTTASKADVFSFIKTGSGAYYGFIVGQNL